jgi:DNA polymerase III delta prime subunit
LLRGNGIIISGLWQIIQFQLGPKLAIPGLLIL